MLVTTITALLIASDYIHPLTRTDKAGLLGSQQQSGRYPTALLRVSHVFPSKLRPYSVDETGGAPLSMKV
jgi:hypothetical protein